MKIERTGAQKGYKKLIEGAADMSSVWFSVLANADVHFSVSKSDPSPKDSWELALGAYSGTRSLIRKTQGGAIIAENKHSKIDYKMACKRDLNINYKKIQMYIVE